MAGPCNTLGISWPPLAMRPWCLLCFSVPSRPDLARSCQQKSNNKREKLRKKFGREEEFESERTKPKRRCLLLLCFLYFFISLSFKIDSPIKLAMIFMLLFCNYCCWELSESPSEISKVGRSGVGRKGGWPVRGLAGQGLASQGLAGQGLAGQGLAGQGLAGQGLAPYRVATDINMNTPQPWNPR
jgi:hypothetical protein